MRKLLGFLCVCALAIVTARAQDAVDDFRRRPIRDLPWEGAIKISHLDKKSPLFEEREIRTRGS